MSAPSPPEARLTYREVKLAQDAYPGRETYTPKQVLAVLAELRELQEALAVLTKLIRSGNDPAVYFWFDGERMGIETGIDLTPSEAKLVERLAASSEKPG